MKRVRQNTTLIGSMRVFFALLLVSGCATVTENTTISPKENTSIEEVLQTKVRVESGDVQAQLSMARIARWHYEDMDEAIGWYSRAAAQGDSSAARSLGDIYRAGLQGVPRNPVEAEYWYRLAIENGGLVSQEVLDDVACVYSEEEIDRFQQSAEAGDPEAQSSVAGWYRHGVCLPPDITKALILYHRSAEQGYGEAQYQLGDFYLHGGFGVPQDVTQAMNWYFQAAAQGNADAARMLGHIYSWGREGSVPKDVDEAKKWYQLAVKNGDTISQKRLDALLRVEDPEKFNAIKPSWLIGDWKGEVNLYSGFSAEMTLQIEKQEAQTFTGHASISGGSFSCKNSGVTLVSDSETKYLMTMSGLGCRGKGTLESRGALLTGKIKFGNEPAKNVALFKRGYGPEPGYEGLGNAGMLLICLNPWTFLLCQ